MLSFDRVSVGNRFFFVFSEVTFINAVIVEWCIGDEKNLIFEAFHESVSLANYVSLSCRKVKENLREYLILAIRSSFVDMKWERLSTMMSY